MKTFSALVAGVAGLLLWGHLLMAAQEMLQGGTVDYEMQDLDIPDPAELDLPDGG